MLTDVGSGLSSIRVTVAHADDREAVARLYAETAYTPHLGGTETLLIAELDGAPIGVLRLVDEYGQLVLRGMRVKAPFQRRGIGTSLLIHAQTEIGARSCYCLPFAHLVTFYSTICFRPVSDQFLPQFLLARAERYRSKGESIAPMFRDAGIIGHEPTTTPRAV